MNIDDYRFEQLKAETWADGIDGMVTFAYWIAVLADAESEFARDAEEVCSAMSFQYEVEEQAEKLDRLRSRPDIIPSLIHPIAPVTLALRWSPFPAAFTALGEPIHLHHVRGRVAAIFRPVDAPTFAAESADEHYFQTLLHHVSARALARKKWVLLAGTPGWNYNGVDLIACDEKLQELMAKFGFVVAARKPQSPG